MEKKKTKVDIYNMKLGEVTNQNMMENMLKAPIKCVGRAVALKDKNGTQMDVWLKHKDFVERDEEEEDD